MVTGGDHYGHEGMVKARYRRPLGPCSKLGELALNNKIEALQPAAGRYLAHVPRYRCLHNIGTITHVGLKTFADPRNGGGKL